ncbi:MULTISPECIES: hypothetical protein [Bacillus subtilis group]|uniref:hypothetical protein n=1 Tax=Bacillus subtilis group TaxID=653685 RepID=UPI0009B7E642|nr:MULTISPECIES: hypothetical protein [Bacillus subtilis group]ARC67262.1 hypothetical protein B14_200051 [Bacillus licheniformis]ARW46097.1 hypothetical protein S100141_04877 [Bacillus licheniformis]MCY1628362.1 hypothetical protein [Bacillus paralicheniformis]MDE1421917.1 hypothetical protein [Bacillus licheniformis]MEC0475922.1 hypothetical protein [Bacillus licheniformis]
MKEQESGFITEAIKQAVQESGLPEDKIEEITSYMVTYLNTGAKYGETAKAFLYWYVHDMGGEL